MSSVAVSRQELRHSLTDMITINLTQNNTEFELMVKGHSGYAENGKDIVCSAVSILLYTLVEAIDEEWLESNPFVVMESGDTLVRVKAKEACKAELSTVFRVITNGLKLVSEYFPRNVIFFSGGLEKK